MRFLNILFVLILSVACGKSASNGSSSAPRQQQTSDGPCLDADGIEIPSCDLLRADGNGFELLESMIDVTADISASDITFHQSRMANDAGRRLKCETAVKDGEVLRYSMMGDTLE